MLNVRGHRIALLAAVIAAGALAAPHPAQAWWRGGFGFGIAPFYYAPYGYYAPPPVYYAPPPAYVAPTYVAPAAGQSCYAGPYVCPLSQPTPVGAPCSCPTNDNGRAGGRVG